LAHDYHQPQSSTLQPRGQSDAIDSPESKARTIRNLRLTPENSLRAVQPPGEFAPRYRLTSSGYTQNVHGPITPQTTLRDDNNRYNGVFSARLDEFGSREVTLWHFRGTIWSYTGWRGTGNQQWSAIYGDKVLTASSYGLPFPEDSSLDQFLTQFVRLPSGILMVPQNARAAVYDGQEVMYLGYDSRPGAPQPRLPLPRPFRDSGGASTADSDTAHDPNAGGWGFSGRVLPWSFGSCRLGTVEVLDGAGNLGGITPAGKKTFSNPNGGVLKEGMIRARLQWINRDGDLSPASAPSTAWTCSKEDNVSKDRKKAEDELAADMRLQAWWDNIAPGPDGTVGRVFSKTRDLINSGDPVYYEVPANSAAGTHEFATIPDNVTDGYPDNVPESWLVAPYTPVDPMPLFRLACLFGNRLWIANMVGDPGLLRASLPMRWGTLPEDEYVYYPDPTGAAITGLVASQGSLLVFTETSTFSLTPNDSGEDYKFSTISDKVGCVSPDSIATMDNGAVVWLSRKGFFAYDGKKVQEVGLDVQEIAKRINPARRHRAVAIVDPDVGEYRCWVPLDQSNENNVCLVFDGQGWREMDHMVVDAACVYEGQDPTVLVAGVAKANNGVDTQASLYTLDRPAPWTREFAYQGLVAAQSVPDKPTWVFRSGWLRRDRAHRRGSPVRLRLWLRESQNTRMSVKVYRDWRDSPAVMNVDSSDIKAPDRFATDDPPAFWGVTRLGEVFRSLLTRTARGTASDQPASFRRRRPYWSKVEVMVPSCEVFSFELTGTGDFEFLGFQYLETPQAHHGGNNMPGGKR